MNNETTAVEVLGYELARIEHQLTEAGADGVSHTQIKNITGT